MNIELLWLGAPSWLRWRLLLVLLLVGAGPSPAAATSGKYYRALGLEGGASDREIRRAYRALAVSKHPDKASEAEREAAQEAFVTLAKAYEVLSDDVKRPRYDYMVKEKGLDVDYNEQMDWTLVDQQIGLISMHHRTTEHREAAGSRSWSLEEAEELARKAEELAKFHKDDDDGEKEEESAFLNTLMVVGLVVTTALSILIPTLVYLKNEKAKAEEKLKKKKPTGEKKAELVARSQEVKEKLAAEEAARNRQKEEARQRNQAAAASQQQQSAVWTTWDATDPFLSCLSWLSSSSVDYASVMTAVLKQQDQPQQGAWALVVLEGFRDYVGEEPYEGMAYALMGLVLDATDIVMGGGSRGPDALDKVEGLVESYLSVEASPVRVKLDDAQEKTVRQALHKLQEVAAAAEEEEEGDDDGDDDDDDENNSDAVWDDLMAALRRMRAVALDRLKQAGGKIKGLKENEWEAFKREGVLAAAKEKAPTLDDVLGSVVATAAFREHCEMEGVVNDLDLLLELREVMEEGGGAEEGRRPGVGVEVVKGLFDKWLGGDENLGVKDDIQASVDDMAMLLEGEEGTADEEGEEENEELLGAYLNEIMEQERLFLGESLTRFQSHQLQGLAGGRPEKSKLYQRLWKAANSVLPPHNATGSQQQERATASEAGAGAAKRRGGGKKK